MPSELTFLARVWLAYACFFRILFHRPFAEAAFRIGPQGELPPGPAALPSSKPAVTPEAPIARVDAALQLLALLQREGRLVDFLEQDVATFADADIGAAARVVHDGCRRALRGHATIRPVREEEEGTRVAVPVGFAPDEIKLTGNVQGAGPYSGVLRHRGWRVTGFALPTAVRAHDASVVAPAEVEL